ncbi:hypothetical protein [Loktanella sp. M215]|uniref:hypothetical protein n=1 Tax=Loktanella sp. M215 TaxID=2675431 RepID=UPI001F489BA1|nr:hypothetical protein [Loktanella sp. M215]MCF7702192.1 hypothetical protein [Loktanella sp. M215]
MIILCILGGIVGAFAGVLTGLWYGIDLLGLVSLYLLCGTVSFVITLAIAIVSGTGMPASSQDITRASVK